MATKLEKSPQTDGSPDNCVQQHPKSPDDEPPQTPGSVDTPLSHPPPPLPTPRTPAPRTPEPRTDNSDGGRDTPARSPDTTTITAKLLTTVSTTHNESVGGGGGGGEAGAIAVARGGDMEGGSNRNAAGENAAGVKTFGGGIIPVSIVPIGAPGLSGDPKAMMTHGQHLLTVPTPTNTALPELPPPIKQPAKPTRTPRIRYPQHITSQLDVMFTQNSYPTKCQYETIAMLVGLDVGKVKVWFQNRRSRNRRNEKRRLTQEGFTPEQVAKRMKIERPRSKSESKGLEGDDYTPIGAAADIRYPPKSQSVPLARNITSGTPFNFNFHEPEHPQRAPLHYMPPSSKQMPTFPHTTQQFPIITQPLYPILPPPRPPPLPPRAPPPASLLLPVSNSLPVPVQKPLPVGTGNENKKNVFHHQTPFELQSGIGGNRMVKKQETSPVGGFDFGGGGGIIPKASIRGQSTANCNNQRSGGTVSGVGCYGPQSGGGIINEQQHHREKTSPDATTPAHPPSSLPPPPPLQFTSSVHAPMNLPRPAPSSTPYRYGHHRHPRMTPLDGLRFPYQTLPATEPPQWHRMRLASPQELGFGQLAPTLASSRPYLFPYINDPMMQMYGYGGEGIIQPPQRCQSEGGNANEEEEQHGGNSAAVDMNQNKLQHGKRHPINTVSWFPTSTLSGGDKMPMNLSMQQTQQFEPVTPPSSISSTKPDTASTFRNSLPFLQQSAAGSDAVSKALQLKDKAAVDQVVGNVLRQLIYKQREGMNAHPTRGFDPASSKYMNTNPSSTFSHHATALAQERQKSGSKPTKQSDYYSRQAFQAMIDQNNNRDGRVLYSSLFAGAGSRGAAGEGGVPSHSVASSIEHQQQPYPKAQSCPPNVGGSIPTSSLVTGYTNTTHSGPHQQQWPTSYAHRGGFTATQSGVDSALYDSGYTSSLMTSHNTATHGRCDTPNPPGMSTDASRNVSPFQQQQQHQYQGQMIGQGQIIGQGQMGHPYNHRVISPLPGMEDTGSVSIKQAPQAVSIGGGNMEPHRPVDPNLVFSPLRSIKYAMNNKHLADDPMTKAAEPIRIEDQSEEDVYEEDDELTRTHEEITIESSSSGDDGGVKITAMETAVAAGASNYPSQLHHADVDTRQQQETATRTVISEQYINERISPILCGGRSSGSGAPVSPQETGAVFAEDENTMGPLLTSTPEHDRIDASGNHYQIIENHDVGQEDGADRQILNPNGAEGGMVKYEGNAIRMLPLIPETAEEEEEEESEEEEEEENDEECEWSGEGGEKKIWLVHSSRDGMGVCTEMLDKDDEEDDGRIDGMECGSGQHAPMLYGERQFDHYLKSNAPFITKITSTSSNEEQHLHMEKATTDVATMHVGLQNLSVSDAWSHVETSKSSTALECVSGKNTVNSFSVSGDWKINQANKDGIAVTTIPFGGGQGEDWATQGELNEQDVDRKRLDLPVIVSYQGGSTDPTKYSWPRQNEQPYGHPWGQQPQFHLFTKADNKLESTTPQSHQMMNVCVQSQENVNAAEEGSKSDWITSKIAECGSRQLGMNHQQALPWQQIPLQQNAAEGYSSLNTEMADGFQQQQLQQHIWKSPPDNVKVATAGVYSDYPQVGMENVTELGTSQKDIRSIPLSDTQFQEVDANRSQNNMESNSLYKAAIESATAKRLTTLKIDESTQLKQKEAADAAGAILASDAAPINDTLCTWGQQPPIPLQQTASGPISIHSTAQAATTIIETPEQWGSSNQSHHHGETTEIGMLPQTAATDTTSATWEATASTAYPLNTAQPHDIANDYKQQNWGGAAGLTASSFATDVQQPVKASEYSQNDESEEANGDCWNYAAAATMKKEPVENSETEEETDDSEAPPL